SQFEMAGRPGGGLYHAQVAQQAQDAYAKLYGDERARQLNAATVLPGITQMPVQLQAQIAQLAGQLPGQAAPFLGRTTEGQTSGTTAGTSSSTGTSTQTQPLYQTPWWQTALGAGTAVAGLAMPGLGGVSALGNIGAGLFGQTAMTNAAQGGLLGVFR